MKVVFNPTKSKIYPPPWDWKLDKPIYLTRNKVYEVLKTKSEPLYDGQITAYEYLVMNDEGYTEWFDEYHFVTLDSIRNDKINSILDEKIKT